MSAVDNPVDATSPKSAKKKKKSKKKSNGKPDDNTDSAAVNGVKPEAGADGDDDDGDDDEGAGEHAVQNTPLDSNDSSVAALASLDATIDAQSREIAAASTASQQQKSSSGENATGNVASNDDHDAAQSSAGAMTASDPTSRFDTLQQERDALREEVKHLRHQLESLQNGQQDTSDQSTLREEIEQERQAREQAETQYRNLLAKVNTIRSQLGERLKADAEELDQARGKIGDLESANAEVKDENERLQQSVAQINARLESQASEIETLRSRTNLSTSNWAKERDELLSKEAYVREEYEVAKQAMQDWEILATEERARREALEERAQELEEQLGGQRDAYERAKNEADTQGNTVDGLQRALRDLQEERKRELREMVEQSQSQLDELRTQAKNAEDTAAELKQQLEGTEKELQRALPYEKEVREKNLLIGKLRHEAVILNDHLTKALRFLKRGKPEDNVDRQLVTNHLLQFLALDRSDAKKFQVLQLIAALLGWDEEQREQAGLLRQGSITGPSSLKLPVSPFRRTPSTPSLSADFMPDSPGGASKDSLAELWSDFLEREAQAGGRSRKGSQATTVRSPSLTGVVSPLSGKFDVGSSTESAKLQRQESGGTRSEG